MPPSRATSVAVRHRAATTARTVSGIRQVAGASALIASGTAAPTMKPSPASTAVPTGVGESSLGVMPCSTSAWCSSASFVLSSSATRRARSGERPLSSYSVASSASSSSGCSSCRRRSSARTASSASRSSAASVYFIPPSATPPPTIAPSAATTIVVTEAPAARRPSTTPAVAITPSLTSTRWARTVCRSSRGRTPRRPGPKPTDLHASPAAAAPTASGRASRPACRGAWDRAAVGRDGPGRR